MVTVMPTPRKPRPGDDAPTGVDGLLDDSSYLSLEHRAQDLDDQDQTATEHKQGSYQQDDADEKIREGGIHKDVLA